MKKLTAICICLLLLAATIAPAVVFGDSLGSAEDIIYFLNPTAITVVGDKLFVADRIESNTSVVLCYDISGEGPELAYTREVDGHITNLAAKTDGLYAILTDKVIEYSVGVSLEEKSTYTVANALDVAYGAHGEQKVEYILKANELVRNGTDGNVATLTKGVSCLAIGNSIYYLYTDNSKSVVKQYDGNQHISPSNSLNNANPNDAGYFLASLNAKGMLEWEGKVALYSATQISYIDMSDTVCSLAPIFTYDKQDTLVDVATYNGNLYVLNDKNKIEIYSKKTPDTFELQATIGSDMLTQDEPSAGKYTSFTLVKSISYPTNIVFKTNGDHTVSNIITNASQYIVIGYEGDEASNFYYVLVEDGGEYRFGWVKKSDGASTATEDAKLAPIDTTWTTDGNVSYKSEFKSLGAVWVYDLPCDQFEGHSFTQSATDKTEVTILQQFVQHKSTGDVTWLYVSYLDGETTKTGFVKRESVGEVRMNVANTKIIANRKINAKLFGTVTVYMFSSPDMMTEDNIAKYRKQAQQGDSIVEEQMAPLKSGQLVGLISEQDGVCLIEVRRSDGAVGYGYVYANQLIGENAMTTNAIVGLSLLGAALILGVTLTAVFIHRKRRTK